MPPAGLQQDHIILAAKNKPCLKVHLKHRNEHPEWVWFHWLTDTLLVTDTEFSIKLANYYYFFFAADQRSLHHITRTTKTKPIKKTVIKASKPSSTIPFLNCSNKQTGVEESKQSKLQGKIKSQRQCEASSVCNNDALNKESNPESLLVKNKKVKMRARRWSGGE